MWCIIATSDLFPRCQAGALDAGLTPGVQAIKDLKPKVLFLLGADEGKVTADDLARMNF